MSSITQPSTDEFGVRDEKVEPETVKVNRTMMKGSFSRLGLQSQGFHPDRFPVDQIYRHWKHAESQVTLIQHILKNPDIFCFADFPFLSTSVELLKAQPDLDNKEIATWWKDKSGLGQLVSTTPGSPSRLIPPSQSPAAFQLMPQLGGPVAAQVGHSPSLVSAAGMGNMGNRLGHQTKQAFDTTSRLGDMSTSTGPFFSESIPVSKEIEDEANSYFQRIYNHPPHPTLSIDEVLEMLKKFQDSNIKREKLALFQAQPVLKPLVRTALALFQAQPVLKPLVRTAVERSIHEWISLVVERAVKIAVNTAEQIVKKDFALDPDEGRMRSAAHHIARNLTAGMAMITCRDQLQQSIKANLKNFMHLGLGLRFVLDAIRNSCQNETEKSVSQELSEVILTMFSNCARNFMHLGLGLRFVLDAIRKPHGSKMYYFGIAALDKFKSKMKDYPKYCEHLASIPHFDQFPPHLIEYIEYGKQALEPPNRPQGSVLPPSLAVGNQLSFKTVSQTNTTTTTTSSITKAANSAIMSSRPSIANATNIDTLLVATETDDKIVVPPENMQDKVGFVFNNLSQLNLSTKCDELRNLVTEEFWPWLSQYLVMKRASIEFNFHVLYSNFLDEIKLPALRNLVTEEFWPWLSQYLVMKRASIEFNFHVLYSNFLDEIKLPDVTDMVIKETYRNIKVLLRSDKGIANFSDRTLLKNLGHWLGMLTLGRNRPILMVDLDLKSLVAEAYKKGQQELLYVVPFVAKVMESCSRSKIFKVPNPWTTAILESAFNGVDEMGTIYDKLISEVEIFLASLVTLVGVQNTLLPSSLHALIEALVALRRTRDAHSAVALIQKDLVPSYYLKDPDNLKFSELQLAVTHKKPPPQALTQPAVAQHEAQQALGASHSQQSTPIMQATSQPLHTPSADAADNFRFSSSNSLGLSSNTSWLPLAGGAGANSIPLGGANNSGPGLNADELLAQINAQSSGAAAQTMAAQSSTPPLTMQQPPEPRYSYTSVNVANIGNIAPHIVINSQLALFQAQPVLKPLVRTAVERSIHEWISLVVERAVKIAVNTAEQIVKKDFALDPDEGRMRSAAHHIARNLTAGMAMITCRDQLQQSIKANLKHLFTTAITNATPQQKELMDQTVTICAGDNMELACAFIQKTAIEKALPDIDKHLAGEYERRKHARSEQRRYCDSQVLTYQAERMPEQIRLKVGGVTPQQMAVYEEFARNIPGFQPLSERDAALFLPKPEPPPPGPPVVPASLMQQATQQNQLSAFNGVDEMGTIYDKLISEVEIFLASLVTLVGVQNTLLPSSLHALIEALVALRRTRDAHSAVALIQKVIENLLDGHTHIPNDPELTLRYKDLHLRIVKALQDLRAFGVQWTNKQITRCLIECREEYRYNLEAVDTLISLQKVIENLLDGHTHIPNDPELTLRYKDLHLRIVKALQDLRAFGVQWTNKQITRCLIECREEYRYNLEAVDTLIRAQLIHLPQYDLALAHSMENGLNYVAVAFCMQLLQHYLVEERGTAGVTESDMLNTLEVLIRIASHHRQPPEGLTALIDMLRANHHDQPMLVERAPGAQTLNSGLPNFSLNAATGPAVHIHSGILQVRGIRDLDDPPGLFEKTEYLLREWVTIYHSPAGVKDPNKAFTLFVHQMNCHGILKSDELITRFFRFATSLVVGVSPTPTRSKMFQTLDAYAKLIALLVKHSGSGEHANSNTKINLLNKVLGIISGVLITDQEARQHEFHQLPYHRIFIMLFLELNVPDPVLEAINFQVLSAYCSVLHILRPSKQPGFAYAWLEIVAHRTFIGRMLVITPHQKVSMLNCVYITFQGWPLYAQLLIDIFKFLAPFLRNVELSKPNLTFYKGVLRVLLVLLHDFPEFLCDYHYQFCDVIPANCIQMRNLILSAFPGNMRLPDPFTPNLKVDTLADINQAPRMHADFASLIQPATFKKDLDAYLKTRSPVTFLAEVRAAVQVSHEPGSRYNTELMNAIVLYVGTQAILSIRAKSLSPNNKTIAHSAHMDIFLNFAVDLDTEGRYLFLNAIANQLRYPNSHTHYFSCLLLYLFAEANTEAIQEQITRVLLERLIVNRPHPWGLLITFIELIKNPVYKFWDHEFVHCAPEIEKLFESVARSCMVQKHTSHTPTEHDLNSDMKMMSQPQPQQSVMNPQQQQQQQQQSASFPLA
ncbi:LOW QUALITY PROTEIN: CCR4-NOT transcription complex subunit 1 [Diaphorina citri]|uniref:LOW QUALITY PROTEIN: CCR4-NOT transcription complex subunit 1 n=1 Tax=Diaphorina citri TaxID=121845 RepID=A0A3Q0IQ96_DIACI|nr:LOW QUALITY PROTEIN: CCR4-NOT transcription complex subunit 1 [Diaphorina citri]